MEGYAKIKLSGIGQPIYKASKEKEERKKYRKGEKKVQKRRKRIVKDKMKDNYSKFFLVYPSCPQWKHLSMCIKVN